MLQVSESKYIPLGLHLLISLFIMFGCADDSSKPVTQEAKDHFRKARGRCHDQS